MRKSTKIWLILAIISNLAMLYFYRPLLTAFRYSEGYISISATWEAYVGLAMFILANLSGAIVISRFIKSQTFSRQIFFTTFFPTITFVSVVFFVFNITRMEENQIATAIRDGLNITTSTARYVWIGIIAIVYAIYLLITYAILSKPIKRLEKVINHIKHGEETKKPIRIGGAKEFQTIEEDLKVIKNEINKIN